ncbi:hypothetical protein AB4Z01_14930 [Inquilinus sp. YAF38]|uniref:hypothetical protein n=1 Tax=Inquilinus sp. YAF38 TaxID=3233084 RepID=UPI003F8F9B1C
MAPLDFAHVPAASHAAPAAAEDPVFAAHRAWEAAQKLFNERHDRLEEQTSKAWEKYGEDCLKPLVSIGVSQVSGEEKFVSSEQEIEAQVARKIRAAQSFAVDLPDGRTRHVKVESRGWVPIEEIAAGILKWGDAMRANLRKAEQRVAEIGAEFGLAEAEAEDEAAGQALVAADYALADCPATTPAGIALKLELAADLFGWGGDTEECRVEDKFLKSITADIERLQPAA